MRTSDETVPVDPAPDRLTADAPDQPTADELTADELTADELTADELTAQRRARLAALRRRYARGTLSEADLATEPITQFQRWFEDAVAGGLTEPNAMVLATAAPGGTPSARTVLLKGVDRRGFVLFTNHGSRKGREMLANPRASLVFPWFEIDRQVVVVGDVEPVGREDSAAYFSSRPHDSRIGAWASHQSTVLPDRATLDQRFAELTLRWPEGSDVPLPDHWGGFRVVPVTVEFWQGRTSRLHDRLRYRRAAGGWVVERLAP